MHSAKWDHSVELAGKTVGVIGTGSTSIQIIPQLQKICKKVIVFMRSPTYVSPPFGAGALSDQLAQDLNKDVAHRQYAFSEEQKKKFKEDPAYHLQFRKTIEAEICALWQAYRQGGTLNNGFRTVITEEMHRRIGPGHERLKQFIIPDWSPGCRRISPGDGYLEALTQPNVECVYGEIEKAMTTGLISKGDNQEHNMDVLVCATGFQPGFRPPFPVTNGTGHTVEQDWGDGINMYFGISAPR
jgi:cation diffusion facilitator CzcD-associated flavoprotein CzcO